MSPPLRFVLVRPRSPGNVGAVARAMKNFGFSDLALVDPRLHRARDEAGAEPFFESESRRMAWHASDLLEAARFFPDLGSAVAECGQVLATAPQAHARVPALSPEGAVEALTGPSDHPGALVFGSESSGLTSEEMALCAGVVVIPTDPAYRDLNLAQSVVVMAYLLFRASHTSSARQPAAASHAEVQRVAGLLLDLARGADFLKQGGEPVARELEVLLHRATLTPREAGLLSSLFRKLRHGLKDGG